MPTVPDAAPQEPLRRYSNIAVAFHWVTVALVLFQLWLGFSVADMTRGPERDHLFTWHRTVGAVILLVVLARLTYRLFNPPLSFLSLLSCWVWFAGSWFFRLFF